MWWFWIVVGCIVLFFLVMHLIANRGRGWHQKESFDLDETNEESFVFDEVEAAKNAENRVNEVGLYAYVAENITCAFLFADSYFKGDDKEAIFYKAFKISVASYYLRGVINDSSLKFMARTASMVDSTGLYFHPTTADALSVGAVSIIAHEFSDSFGIAFEEAYRDVKTHMDEISSAIKDVLDQGKKHPTYIACGDIGYKKIWAILN